MNILITGIHGFVGNHLVANLKKKYIIYGLDIIAPEKEGVIYTYSWKEINILPNIDVIIHLAGKAHDTKKQTDFKSYFDINTGLTEKIFQYFLNSTAKKFIFFSSVKAVADSIDHILTEEEIPEPKGPYGKSKIAAEEYILSKDWQEKQVYILRPCMIHGSGNKGNLNLLYNMVKKGIPYPLGQYENRRSFTSIDNLIFIIQGLLFQNVESGIYNIADDQPISTKQLISIISEELNIKRRIWNIPKFLIAVIVCIGDIFHFPFNTFRLNKLIENYIVSNEKIKNALKITKFPISVEEGLRKTIKSF
jgi:nucleoside-diphosphate-sugar epimerase